MQVLRKNEKIGKKGKIDMTIIYIKMQVGNFSLHVRELRLAGLFVNRNNIHKKAVRCETSRPVFFSENYKTTKLHLKNQGIRAQPEDEAEPTGGGHIHITPQF